MQLIAKRVRPKDAAAMIGIAPSTLAKMRMRGDGPAYVKVNNRVVVYEISEIDKWINERRRISTSQETGSA